MDAVVYSLALAGITGLAFFLALRPFDRRLGYIFGVLFALYIGLDDLATGLPPEIAELRFVDARWNWSGKAYSLVLSAVVIFGLRMRAEAVGLVLAFRNVKVCTLALIPLVAIGVVLGLVFDPAPPSAETLAFQLSMPGLAEELAYRGIAPALLLGLVRGRPLPSGVPWIVLSIAAVPYAVVHALGYDGGIAFSFDWGQALYIYSGGLIYGWLRFSSGSLLFPLLAHSLTNVAFHLTTQSV